MPILLEQLFDYAGLFPPTKLPLDTALSNYMTYQTHPNHKMLGKFILPAAQCPDAASTLEHKAPTQTLLFSILLTQAKNEAEILSILQHDSALLKNFVNKNKNCLISSFEISLPIDCYKLSSEQLSILIDKMLEILKTEINLSTEFDFFCEMPFLSHIQMTQFLSNVYEYNNSERCHKISIKLRTGGVTPQSVPSSETLAEAIILLGKFSISFKVTAGLHVPIPNFNAQVNAKMHGFLNVLFAGMCAFWDALPSDIPEFPTEPSLAPYIKDIIANLDYTNLTPQSEHIVLNIPSHPKQKILFTPDIIDEFRKKYFKGIGTCDFIEPTQYLIQNINWLVPTEQ